MVPGYIALVVLIAARVDQVLSRGGCESPRCRRRWCFSLAAVVAVHHIGVVLSRDRALGPCPDQALGGAISAL